MSSSETATARQRIHLRVNGAGYDLEAEPDADLLGVLRDTLGLTGPKYGCGEAKCGACMVLLDGQPHPACFTPVAEAQGKDVTTIEGIAPGDTLHPVQQAFLDEDALQCGYCTPGMIVSSVALLREHPLPTEPQIVQALQRHICRCGTYRRILCAVQRAASQGPAPPLPRAAPWEDTDAPAISHAGPFGMPSDPGRLFDRVGAGLIVLSGVAPATESEDATMADPQPAAVAAWLHIAAESGQVTAYSGKAEVGQNARTSLAQTIAEELCLPPASVRMVLGDTDRTPYDRGTFGSRTTPTMAPHLRRAAAHARQMLLALAAEAWGVDPASVFLTSSGSVTDNGRERSLPFGALLAGRRLHHTLVMEEGAPMALPSPRTALSAPKANGIRFVTGQHRYTSDIQRPGMLYGKVLRPPVFGATLADLDTAEAEALSGITVVRESGSDGAGFVGVTAPTPREAARALAALRPRWALPTGTQPSDTEFFDRLREDAEADAAGEPLHSAPEGTIVLAAAYSVSYIAHAPLEPRAAFAEWDDADRLTIWTGTQRPFGVQEELQAAFGLPAERVRVIVPDTGSGYGGKHTGEAALEAARLARAVGGRPVKLVWTREEEFTWAYFRPAGLLRVAATASADGKLTAWRFDNYNSGAAGLRSPYDIPDCGRAETFHEYERPPLRQGSYRALAATANHFARESHMDDLAHAAGLDPLEFRRRNLSSDRLRAVLEAATERFGWKERAPLPGRRGYGLACGTEKGSYIANCVEVRLDEAIGAVTVARIVTALECGAIINPTHLHNQVEGATVMGLGGALFEAVRFANGRILNPRFADYRVPRFADVPRIEVILLDRRDLPSAGAGETPIVAIAPAIANALRDATGIRRRSLPLYPEQAS